MIKQGLRDVCVVGFVVVLVLSCGKDDRGAPSAESLPHVGERASGAEPPAPTLSEADSTDANSSRLALAATQVIRFLRGEADFDSIRLADTVGLYLGREEGGTRRDVARQALRDRVNWHVRSPSLRHTYSFVPPTGSAELTTSVGRHRNCADYPLSATFPELARLPHVGTTLRYGTDSCLQTWNLTLVFDQEATPPELVAVVYDQPEW